MTNAKAELYQRENLLAVQISKDAVFNMSQDPSKVVEVDVTYPHLCFPIGQKVLLSHADRKNLGSEQEVGIDMTNPPNSQYKVLLGTNALSHLYKGGEIRIGYINMTVTISAFDAYDTNSWVLFR